MQDDAYNGMFAASLDWVTSVTYTKISESVLGTVFLSIALAGIVVFVFSGRPLLSLIATVTVLLMSITVMGMLFLMDWNLGAIEGMSITSLVGLSVDFCIHVVEGHVHARAHNRVARTRCGCHPLNLKCLVQLLVFPCCVHATIALAWTSSFPSPNIMRAV